MQKGRRLRTRERKPMLQVNINDIIETWRSSYNDLKVTYDLKYETVQLMNRTLR